MGWANLVVVFHWRSFAFGVLNADLNRKFFANHAYWGYPSFIELDKLQNPSNGYIIEFSKVSSEDYQVILKDDEAVEFKDLGQIEKA